MPTEETPDEMETEETQEGSEGEAKAQPNWEYRERLAIHDNMDKVVRLTIEATRAQIDLYKRKLDKLTYGS